MSEFEGSPALDAASRNWRPNHHEGWAQRWLTQQLGQVTCKQWHEFPECDIWSECPHCAKCVHCGAAL